MAKLNHITLILLYLITQTIEQFVLTSSVTYLTKDSKVHVIPEIGKLGYAIEKMNVYCYEGSEKDFTNLFKTILLVIDTSDDDFNLYYGFSETDIKQAQKSQKSLFSFNFFSHNKKKDIVLNPFNQTCIGIETASEYRVMLKHIRVDISKVAMFIIGITIFFSAAKLSQNEIFFYLSGIIFGVLTSVLILIWFLSKLIPKKPLMYGALFSGWALVAYFAQFIYDNIQPLLVVYQRYVLAYVLVTSAISFGVCFYIGPPKNNKIKHLIKWSLQSCALLAIFFSTELKEAIYVVIAVVLLLYYCPKSKLPVLGGVWNRLFPPKLKLLTKEEFEEQGRIETEKALKELREYVKSPNCKQWKVVMNLSQPSRFASFVEGDNHITQDETFDYESTINDLSGDSDSNNTDSSEIDESIAVDRSLKIINKSKIQRMNDYSKDATSRLTNSASKQPIINSAVGIRNLRKQNGSMKKNQSTKNYEMSEESD